MQDFLAVLIENSCIYLWYSHFILRRTFFA